MIRNEREPIIRRPIEEQKLVEKDKVASIREPIQKAPSPITHDEPTEARIVAPAVARSESSDSANIIAFLNTGDVVLKIGDTRENGYSYCSYDGNNCWVLSELLQ